MEILDTQQMYVGAGKVRAMLIPNLVDIIMIAKIWKSSILM